MATHRPAISLAIPIALLLACGLGRLAAQEDTGILRLRLGWKLAKESASTPLWAALFPEGKPVPEVTDIEQLPQQSGRFTKGLLELDSVKHGRYQLRIYRAPTWFAARYPDVKQGTAEEIEDTVPWLIEVTGPLTEVEINSAPSDIRDSPASQPARTATIQGRVLIDEEFYSMPGLKVRLWVVDQRWYDLPVDTAGAFRLEGIVPGRGILRISAPAFQEDIEDLSLKSGETRTVDPIDLRGRLHPLRFTVLDADTRAPLVGVPVREFLSTYQGGLGITDSKGQCVIMAGAQEALMLFSARQYGGRTIESARDGAEIALTRWRRIRVHLSDEIPLATRSVESCDGPGLLVAATEDQLNRCSMYPDLRFNPGLALVGTEPIVELFVPQCGDHRILLARTCLNFKNQLCLERLSEPFFVEIPDGLREADVALTCDARTATEIREGLRKAGLR